MATLDAGLRILLAQQELRAQDPDAGPALDPAAPLYLAVEFKGTRDALEALGFQIGSTVGDIAFGQTTIAGLAALAAHPQTGVVQKMRRRQLHDGSVPEIKATQVRTRSGDNFSGYTGRGVLIGIIDTGTDFRHQTFRKPDGKTRIYRLWDQTLTKQSAEKAPDPVTRPSIALDPTPLGYGVEYTDQHINDTLAGGSPAVPVRHVDVVGHGTHVAGIAAGDGSQAGHCHGKYTYIGVATEADLVVVRLWGLSPGETGAPATPNDVLIDAIRYILNVAQSAVPPRPVVINSSTGMLTEFMDGTAPTSRAMDRLLTNNSTGTAMVLSTGNDGASLFHATGTIPAKPAAGPSVVFTIQPDDPVFHLLAVRFTGNKEIRLSSPVAGAPGVIEWLPAGPPVDNHTMNGAGAGSSVAIVNSPNQAVIAITPPTGQNNMAGPWTLELRDTAGAASPFDAYILYCRGDDPKAPRFQDHVTTHSTLSGESTGNEIIAVGAYREGGNLSAFSSRGPTFDGRTLPTVCAPGEDICSAGLPADRTCENCCCACCHDFYVDKTGTSQAAPHVTGIVALMLHKNPTLTHTAIRDLLTGHTAGKPAGSPPDDDFGWGAGRVDAKQVLDNVAQVNPPVPRMAAAPAPLADLYQRLLAARGGSALEAAVRTHGDEVWSLIQRHRRVATIWHRCAGPVWVRLALRAAHSPEQPLPLQANGVDLRDALRRFGTALQRWGSAPLRAAVQAWADDIDRIAEGMNVLDVIDAIGAQPGSSSAGRPAPSPEA